MTNTTLLAKHLSDVYFGGNWTAVNMKDAVTGVDWRQATQKVNSLNTIAALVFHINYYVDAILKVLLDQPLDAKDKFSFDHPPVQSENEWQHLLEKSWTDAEELAKEIEKIPDSRLPEIFVHEKYGTYHRNFIGLLEHTHYHLGQIVIVKKIIQAN